MKYAALGLFLVLSFHQTSAASSAKGRYIWSWASSDILEEGDQACMIVIEPKEGEFVGLYSPKKKDCFTEGEKDDKALDKNLRGKFVSASDLEELSKKELAFVTEAKFLGVPKGTEFLRLTDSYKVGKSIVKGKLHAYECKEVASVGTVGTFTSLTVNATALFLKEEGENSYVGVPDSSYRRSAPDLRRYKFGAASGCPYEMEATIQTAAFKGKEPVDVRVSCPSPDDELWVRLKCEPAK